MMQRTNLKLGDTLPAPVFVVGQPRSGSTIITRVLNDVPGLFVINDFYVLQKIDADGLWHELSSADAGKIAGWIYRIIEIRATQQIGKTLDHPIHLTLDQLGDLKKLVNQNWPDGLFWHQVLSEVMSSAARSAGCNRWGYNTPQDHLHLTKLFNAYPECRVIMQLRQPEAVLKSYKNVVGWWHDARRYNPVTIAMAWRAAALSYQSAQETHPDQIMFVAYESLVKHTDRTMKELALFLGAVIPAIDLSSYGRNSSFHDGAAKKSVTDTEIWVCEHIIGSISEQLGFEKNTKSGFSWRGVTEVIKSFFASIHLFFDEYLFNSDQRTRLKRVLFRRLT